MFLSRAKRSNKDFPYNKAEVSFVSNEDKLAFLDAYNVMCFYQDYELFAFFFYDIITWQDLLDVKEFYQNKSTFYSNEKVRKF